MAEPKIEDLVEAPEGQGSIKNNPLTFVKGGLLETEDQELTPEDLLLLPKKIKTIKTDLQTFADTLQKVERSEEAYPGVPFLTTIGGVSTEDERYEYLNREERKSLDMSVDRVSILVNRKNFEILNRYLQKLESLYSTSRNL